MWMTPAFYVSIVLCFVGYFIFRFGILSRGNKNTQTEFVGGLTLLASFFVSGYFVSWVSILVLVLVFWVVVTPIVEFIVRPLFTEKPKVNDSISIKARMSEEKKKHLQGLLVDALREAKEDEVSR